MEKMPQSIAKGLVLAQGAMRRVGHDAANAFHKYKYTSAEALIEAAREPMMAGGLALIEAGFTLTVDPIPMVSVTYYLASKEGESWELPLHTMPVLEEKGRPLDKAVATARTYALGYALRGVLKIPRTESDDDVDQRDDRNREPPPRTSRSPEEREFASWVTANSARLVCMPESHPEWLAIRDRASAVGVPWSKVMAKISETAKAAEGQGR